MRKCIFYLSNNIQKIHRFTYKGESYVDGLIQACECFKQYDDISNLHLRTTASFENRVMSIEELHKVFLKLNSIWPERYTKERKGINEESIAFLNDEVLLIIIGSAIPENIEFFYTGSNNKIYGWIDRQKNTNLKWYAISKDYKLLKEELKKLHIVFFDIADRCVNYMGSDSDDDILGYTVDDKLFGIIKNSNATIVAATGNANNYLNKVAKIKSELYSLMAYAKEMPWKILLNRVLR